MNSRLPLLAVLVLSVHASGAAAQNFESGNEEILRIAEETRTKVYKKWFEPDEVAGKRNAPSLSVSRRFEVALQSRWNSGELSQGGLS